MALLRVFAIASVLGVVVGRSEDEEACASGSCTDALAGKKARALLQTHQTRGSVTSQASAPKACWKGQKSSNYYNYCNKKCAEHGTSWSCSGSGCGKCPAEEPPKEEEPAPKACWKGQKSSLYFNYCNKKCAENGLGYSCSGGGCGKCKAEEPKEEVTVDEVTSEPGWVLADAGSNCARACTSKGLVCKKNDLLAKIPEVDSKEDIQKVAKSLGVECDSYSKQYGTSMAIPLVSFNPDGNKCSYSLDRDLSNVDCSHFPKSPTKSGIFKHRICYCSLPKDKEPEPPKPDEVSPQCYPDCAVTGGAEWAEKCKLPECDGCPKCDEIDSAPTPGDEDGDAEEVTVEPDADPVAPPPLTCEPLCERNTKDWQVKCGWSTCGGCEICKTTKPCWSFCATKPYEWSAKCEWSNCIGCSECA